MDLSQLHLAHPYWLWTLLVIPLVWILFFLYYRPQQPLHQLEKFVDKHLIPYLLVGGESKKKRVWTPLLLWSLVWSCLVLALAGPRWNFREIDTFTRDQSLVILLDLSESMNAQDIPPSRLARAKQKIEDLLDLSKGVKIGLIAFAADPHMIVPLTEDRATIRHLLSSLNTDLVYVQGSKLTPALDMAWAMLENETGHNKAIVVISDGGFDDASALHTVKKLADKEIAVYTIGVGSLEGIALQDRQGVLVKKNGSKVVSKLEKERFREISQVGHGRYFEAGHGERLGLIFEDLEKRSDLQQKAHSTQRLWEEHFYLFLIPVLPFFLWWYRRGYIFVCLLVMLIPAYSQASLSGYFYNTEQQAQQAYESQDYSTAGITFQDPYRRGVSYYRAGDYKAAEEMFRQSTRPEVAASAGYNLGNTLVQQNQLQEAVKAYEDVLAKWPDHKLAQDNLEAVKKILEQSEQQPQDSQDGQENSESSGQRQKDRASQAQQDTEKDSTSSPEQSEGNHEPDSSGAVEPQQNPSAEKESPSQEDMSQPEQSLSPQSEREGPASRSQEDLDADLWLNQIKNDPKTFLKNKFYLESKKNGTKEEVDPW